MPGELSVSCCVIAKGRHHHLTRLLDGLSRQTTAPDETVIVSMGDPAIVDVARRSGLDTRVSVLDVPAEASLPLAAARNRAARIATGDLLVFLDVDCIPDPDLVVDHRAHARPGLLMGTVRYLPPGVPGALEGFCFDELEAVGETHVARPAVTEVERAPAELFWSLDFAATRETWCELGGFDERFVGYGGEDTDLGFTARQKGIAIWSIPGATAYHQHHETHDPPVQHLVDIVANARCFRAKWGVWPMRGWLRAFADRGLVRWGSDDIELVDGAAPAAVQPR